MILPYLVIEVEEELEKEEELEEEIEETIQDTEGVKLNKRIYYYIIIWQVNIMILLLLEVV